MSKHAKTPWALFDAGDFIYINEKDGPGFICAVNVASHHAEKCRANARYIVHCVNNHERLVEALAAALEYIEQSPCDPDIYPAQLAAWGELTSLEPHKLLAALEAEKGGEL